MRGLVQQQYRPSRKIPEMRSLTLNVLHSLFFILAEGEGGRFLTIFYGPESVDNFLFFQNSRLDFFRPRWILSTPHPRVSG